MVRGILWGSARELSIMATLIQQEKQHSFQNNFIFSLVSSMTHLLKNEVENRFPVTATVKVLPTPPHLPRVPRAAVTEERLVWIY